MYLGKLVEEGPAAEVYSNPRHHYTRALIDTIPVADPHKERGKTAVPLSGEMPSAADLPSGCRFRTRCPRAQELCALEEPVLQPAGAGAHRVACHFPLEPGGAGGT